jgi:hypothetical protein
MTYMRTCLSFVFESLCTSRVARASFPRDVPTESEIGRLCVRACVCVCMCRQYILNACMHVDTCVRTCTFVHFRARHASEFHSCMHHVCVYAKNMCMHAYVHACVCVYACVRVYMYTYIPYIYIYTHTYIHTYKGLP